jgi:hypothetical protein
MATKTCPFCAEEIQQEAVVCKHCRRDLQATTAAGPVKAAPKTKGQDFGVMALGILLLFVAAGASTLGASFAGWLFLAAFAASWIGGARVLRGGAVLRWGGGFVIACLLVVGLAVVVPIGGSQPADGRAVMPQGLLQAAPVVTKAEFDTLSEGMTYEEAIRIIGAAGELQSSSDLAGHKTVMYSWMNANGSNMNAMFQNGKLITKAQFGLP